MDANDAAIDLDNPPDLSSVDGARRTLEWFIAASSQLEPEPETALRTGQSLLAPACDYLRDYVDGVKKGLSPHDAMLAAERRDPGRSWHDLAAAQDEADA